MYLLGLTGLVKERELVVAVQSEKESERSGVAVQSNAWRLNLFLTELYQC